MNEQAVSVTTKPAPTDVTDDDRALLEGVFARFSAEGSGPLFTTDAEALWPRFLEALPSEELRRVYACRTCQRFVERYGGLATINANGASWSALWTTVGCPWPFQGAVGRLAERVTRARVTGVFLSSEGVLGTPVTGVWNHLSVSMGKRRFAPTLRTAEQVAAEKHEDYGTLCRGLVEFSEPVVRNAVQILSTGDHLYRSEKVLGAAEWLLALHERRAATKNTRVRENLTWLAVATAPSGFAHVRSTMIGTLLEDLASGLDFEDVKRRFAAKMHPLQYQRPTAAPSAGQIAQAEAIVQTLDAAGALRRRFARLEDVTSIWEAKPPAFPAGDSTMFGVFSHLTPKPRAEGADAVEAPASAITWEKFARTVLPEALTIEYFAVPSTYIALTTAVDPAAPPILQWDDMERRNPVAWYVYSRGSTPEQFNLRAGSWVPATAVCLLPPQWGLRESRPHWGEGVIFLLDGAKDMRWQHDGGGMGFFPEQLRAELHAVRKTLEAYARAATVEGRDEATACGLDLRKGLPWGQTVRVTSRLGRARYRLERWD